MYHRYPLPAAIAPAPFHYASRVQHDVFVFDADGKRLGHVGAFDQRRARRHRNRKLPRPDARRIAPGFAGAYVELPTVPWAADDLALPRIAVLAGLFGLDQSGQAPFAQAAALMRAAVGEREELALDVEHCDLAALDVDELAGAGRKLAQRSDHVFGHGVTRPARRDGCRSPARCRAGSCRVVFAGCPPASRRRRRIANAESRTRTAACRRTACARSVLPPRPDRPDRRTAGWSVARDCARSAPASGRSTA